MAVIISKDGIAYSVEPVAINENELIEEKQRLENIIKISIPVLKEKPDEETLELWNNIVKRQLQAIEAIKERQAAIDEKINIITAAKDDEIKPIDGEITP